jgi:dihydroneopterin aldolase
MHTAAETDNIEDALNYQVAYQLVKREMAKRSHLLEHIGKRILDALYAEFSVIEKASVKISKMNPPMGGKMKCVSVTINR